VLRRDHQRCTVPGCRNARFLDVHHIKLRSEGGGNEADNLITLCGVHHRAAHRGELVVTGSVSTGVRFRHADGSDYGRALEPRVAEIQAKAFLALRGLGFREGEVRRALAESRKRGDDRQASIERVVRDALAELTPLRTNS
jgi:Holliday junction resolvasome RuvABC DNA-binding subunit